MGSKQIKKWIVCSDPFGQHKSKIKKNKTFLEVTAAFALERLDCVPNLHTKLQEGEVWLCSFCVWRVRRVHTKCATKVPDVSKLSLNTSELTDEGSSDTDFANTNVDKEILAGQLKNLGVKWQFLEKQYVSKKSVEICISELDEKFRLIKENLYALSGKNNSRTDDSLSLENDTKCKICMQLIAELSEKFKTVLSKEDKYKILTCIPQCLTLEGVCEKFDCSMYMVRKASVLRKSEGCYVCPAPIVGRKLPDSRKSLITSFYQNDEMSRVDPSTRSARLGKKGQGSQSISDNEHHEKRHILMSLSDLYTLFVETYPEEEVSVSAFAKLRPSWCIFPGSRGHHLSCTCVTHENFDLLLVALKVKTGNLHTIQSLVCDTDTENCWFGLCNECPKISVINSWFDGLTYSEITFNQWGTLEGNYGTNLNEKVESLHDFRNRFNLSLLDVLPHHYVMKKQFEYVKILKEHVLPTGNFGIMQVDYAQNYNCIIQSAVQGYHWSGSQVTIHPFVLTWNNQERRELQSRSYVIISDYLTHDAEAFHAYRVKVIKQLQTENLQITKIFYLSDGAGSQYKNKKNFVNLLHHKSDFNIEAQWDFFASSHGKGPCDAIGAIVKKTCNVGSLKIDPQTKQWNYLRTAEDVAEYAGKKLNSSTVQILYVSSAEVIDLCKSAELQLRYESVKTIAGTRLFHSFSPVDEQSICVRRYSLCEVSKIVRMSSKEFHKPLKYRVDDFVAVKMDHKYNVGKIISISGELYSVEFLRRKAGCNLFTGTGDRIVYDAIENEIIRVVKHIDYDAKKKEFKLSTADFKALESAIKR